MKRLFLASLAGLGLVWNAGADPVPIYENFGQVSEPPQIDATAFLNAGSFDVFSSLPFETQNTLYYTNRGTMNGSVGFRFEYSSQTGRQPASSFENQQTILAEDRSSIFFSSSGLGGGGYLGGSYVLVSATNIVNSGLISAGAGGLVRLAGHNLDLSHGGISATEPAVPPTTFMFSSSIGLGYDAPTNYINPADVSDLYWGIGVGDVLSGDPRPLLLDMGLFNLPFPQSPQHQVVDASGFTNEVMLPYSSFGSIFYGTNLFTNVFSSFAAYAYTNQPTATNEVIQVVFVARNPADTNLSLQVRFARGTGGDPAGGRKAMVQFQLTDVDVVTDTPLTNYIYFEDDSASLTNSILKENLVASTFRPSAFRVTRATPFDWRSTVSSNTAFNNSLLFNSNFTNNIVTNAYSAYSAQIGQGQDSTSLYSSVYGSQFGNPALSDPTNFPGRVELVGAGPDPRSDELDLTAARIRCEGLLTLKTKHLLGTAQSKIDAPLLSIDLGSTNQTLLISNLFPNTVKRLKGQLFAWSGVWTNQRSLVITTNDPASTNSVSVTNMIDVRFHVLILDHSIQTVQTVAINEFLAQGTHVILADGIHVNRNFRVDAPNLTIEEQLTMPNSLGATNLPQLLNLTNRGSIYIPEQGIWGADRSQGLNQLVNLGTISGGGHQIKATNFFNGGIIDYLGTNLSLAGVSASSGAIQIESETSELNYGQLTAQTDVNIKTGDLLALYSSIRAGSISVSRFDGTETVSPGSILLSVTNSLSDGGPGASNEWQCVGPFNLNVRPPRGDLFGTRLASIAPKFAVLREVWAGEDRGASAAGFTNNAALGWLVLDGKSFSKFVFSGPGTNNALYVDYLELRGNATNFTSALQIDPNMRLYFANANLPPEKLNGKLGGRLLWVSTFTGPNSSTNWTSTSGRVFTVNSALLQSEDIDSDLDGSVNRLDPTPFYTEESAALGLGLTAGPPPLALLSWIALANVTNVLEFKTDLFAPAWQTLTNFVPSYPTHPVTVGDPLPGSGQRYYRVRVLTSQP